VYFQVGTLSILGGLYNTTDSGRYLKALMTRSELILKFENVRITFLTRLRVREGEVVSIRSFDFL